MRWKDITNNTMLFKPMLFLCKPKNPNPPAAIFASKGDAHVRNDAQIKFLHYPLYRYITSITIITIIIKMKI